MGRVFVAISGGVDSSYALMKTVAEGEDPIAVVMDLGLGYEVLDAAKAVVFRLGVPLVVVRLSDEFESLVVDYFVEEYLRGRTPNPCALCNREIKFGVLKEHISSMGGETFITGHYACLREGHLFRAKDGERDQSYFLSLVPRERFAGVRFPLCSEVKREILKQLDGVPFPAESREVCFLKGKDYRQFLLERVGERPGFIYDTSGKRLGEHKGCFLFTIGQRKGLGVSVGRPMYVVEIRPQENTVVLGDERELYSEGMLVSGINWFVDPGGPLEVEVKIRHQHTPVPAVLHPDGRVEFSSPQRAVTPGQVACFYAGDEVVAAGFIERSCKMGC